VSRDAAFAGTTIVSDKPAATVSAQVVEATRRKERRGPAGRDARACFALVSGFVLVATVRDLTGLTAFVGLAGFSARWLAARCRAELTGEYPSAV
jgi:hypothetical protein